MDATQMSDNSDPSETNSLNNHGNTLFSKFRLDPSLLDDLDAAVKALDNAVIYASTTDSTPLSLLSDLLDAVGKRLQWTVSKNGPKKLDTTIQYISEMDTVDNSMKAVWTNRLGYAFRNFFYLIRRYLFSTWITASGYMIRHLFSSLRAFLVEKFLCLA